MNYKSLSLILTLMALSICACTDNFYDSLLGNGDDDENGIQFAIGVEEQADMIYETAQQTRANRQTAQTQTNRQTAQTRANKQTEQQRRANQSRRLPFDGDNELSLHRMPLPLVGIHPHTAKGSSVQSATRALESDIATDGINFHDSLSVWGYTNTGNTLFNQTLMKKVRGWRSSVQWPYNNGTAMNFYAISPSMESLEGMKLTNTPNFNTLPTFTYEVPVEPSLQRDLLFARCTTNTNSTLWGSIDIASGPTGKGIDPKTENLGEDNKLVKLKFIHILTAIRFAQGKMPVGATVKGIRLLHIKNRGNFNPANLLTSPWSNQSGSETYEISVSSSVTEYAPENVYIDGGNVLFMIPQNITTNDAEIQVDIDYNGRERTLRTKLNGDVWLPGYTVTYKVSIGELSDDYYLVVEPDPSNYETSGSPIATPTQDATGTTDKYGVGSKEYEHSGPNVGSFTIHSFRNYKNFSSSSAGVNNHHAVGWHVVGLADPVDGGFANANYTLNNANADHWITSLMGWNKNDHSATAQTGGDNQTITYTMATQTPVNTAANNHASILTNNNPIKTAGGMNLSTHLPLGSSTDGTLMSGCAAAAGSNNIYNSANCYIVNAKGTYKFPLVYGNAYQRGIPVINSSNNPGNVCIDHNGNPIQYANIIRQVNSQPAIETSTTTVSDETGFYITSAESAAGVTRKVKEVKPTYGLHSAADITAELVWQDAPNQFVGVNFALSPTENTVGFINFTVNDNENFTLQPANCLIALKGKCYTQTVYHAYKGETEFFGTIGGITYPTPVSAGSTAYTDAGTEAEILWTWHIWLTDEIYPNANSSTVDQFYPSYNSSTNSKIVSLYKANGDATGEKLLPVNLGWVPDNLTWNLYQPREIWVKIEQNEGTPAQVVYLKLRKEAQQDIITGTSTVYQWGRPTPLPMVNHIDGTDRTIYKPSGAFTAYEVDATFRGKTITRPQEFLQYPTRLLHGTTSNTRWWESGDMAFWSDTKTLYDPSPVGFKMPQGDLFKFFSLTADNLTAAAESDQLNLWNEQSGALGRGAWLYAKAHNTTTAKLTAAERYGYLLYVPASGEYKGDIETKVMRAGAASNSFESSSWAYLWTCGKVPGTEIENGYRVELAPAKQTTLSNPFLYNGTTNLSTALPVRATGE